MAGAVGRCPPRTKRGGELPTLATPPRVGPKTLANPKPTRVGKRGSRGRKPPGRGFWEVSPQNKKRGRVAHISNSATSGTQYAGKPKVNRGGKTCKPFKSSDSHYRRGELSHRLKAHHPCRKLPPGQELLLLPAP